MKTGRLGGFPRQQWDKGDAGVRGTCFVAEVSSNPAPRAPLKRGQKQGKPEEKIILKIQSVLVGVQ